MGYIAGDFWRICDRCGFKTRSSQTFRTWDGLFVCYADWETRHPQDFVRGRKDNQNVPDARPEAVDNIIGSLATNISVAAIDSDTTLNVDSSVRFQSADNIGIICDDGITVTRVVNTVPTPTSITITAVLGHKAAVGNIVINYSATSVADIG